MSIHLRKRGEVWHARGTIRVGQTIFEVKQFSTGCNTRADAEAVASAREAEIRAEILSGDSGKQLRRTLNDAILAYIQRPGGVKQYDKERLLDIAERVGERSIKTAPEAWESWLRMRAVKMAPGTVARWRAVFVAALKAGCESLQAGDPPTIPGVRQLPDERVVYLTDKVREALLQSYNPAAGRVALALAYQGLRTQEALRLDWRYVDLERGSLFVANHGRNTGSRTKTGAGRSLPMHPRVQEMMRKEWDRQGQPSLGPVFLNRKNQPYRDTRGIGGNPISKAHKSACIKAKVADFRVHDWRHDWASRLVMSGVDLETLRRLGGWANLRMIQRYASVSQDHMRESIARLA